VYVVWQDETPGNNDIFFRRGNEKIKNTRMEKDLTSLIFIFHLLLLDISKSSKKILRTERE
jgi:hypothetical protein